ncbi:hypothetical protein B0H17DRAFT_1047230 [Mycena rosella]|uniref:Secreted protein n=1 Tax=Mycena rosella TaxID=1033263 RepID=A0AAD7DW83_MYCRO|nr:hypothetical protein B0H17DRAFT_1047230 [Mycena rosella]
MARPSWLRRQTFHLPTCWLLPLLLLPRPQLLQELCFASTFRQTPMSSGPYTLCGRRSMAAKFLSTLLSLRCVISWASILPRRGLAISETTTKPTLQSMDCLQQLIGKSVSKAE